ncbi:MAG: hypothetical protein WDO74_31570 [Pseudomonadota bacterium]
MGTAIGLALGVLLCKVLLVHALPLDPKVYFISHLPVQVRPMEFVMVGVFAILVCLAATVWPALHAARLRPGGSVPRAAVTRRREPTGSQWAGDALTTSRARKAPSTCCDARKQLKTAFILSKESND